MKSVITDSVITYDELIDMPENEAINAINKKAKHKIYYFIFAVFY